MRGRRKRLSSDTSSPQVMLVVVTAVGTVRSLQRYPVKSMVGESLDELEVSASGIPGDRTWAVRNLDVGEQQGARKLPRLLGLRAWFSAEDAATPIIGFPDGTTLRADSDEASEKVGAHVGANVELVTLQSPSDLSHFRNARLVLNFSKLREELGVSSGEHAPDISSLGLRKLVELFTYATPPGTYFDAYPLHVLTTSSLRYVSEHSGNSNVDARRYRPNVVIDSGDAEGLLEPDWEGASVEIGECRIRIEARTIRCSIPGRAQAIEGIGADKDVVRAVADHADRHLGAYASIERPGRIGVGDPVRLLERRERPLEDGVRRVQQSVVRAAVRFFLGDRNPR